MPSNTIDVTVQNGSGKSIYIAVQQANSGPWINPIASSTPGWVADFDAKSCMHQIQSGDSFNYKFPQITRICDQTTGALCGARMYMSEGPLDGAPDLNTFQYVYDKLEMGWNAVWNQTNVDFFGFPFQLSANGQQVGYRSDVARSDMLHFLQDLPSPYPQLAMTDKSGTVLRFFAPMQKPGVVGDILRKAIASGLPLLAKYPGTFDYGGYEMSGFLKLSDTSLGCSVNGETITLTNIDTSHSLSDTITPTPDDDAGQKVAGIIGAGINRGVLYDPSKWGVSGGINCGNPWDYYQDSPGNQDEFNQYAKVLHDYSIAGKCYAISYDDFFAQAAAIQVDAGDTATIAILPFENSGPLPAAPNTFSPADHYSLSFGVSQPYPFASLGAIKVGDEVFTSQYDLVLCNIASKVAVGFTKLAPNQVINLDLETGQILNPECIPGLVLTDDVLYFPADPQWSC